MKGAAIWRNESGVKSAIETGVRFWSWRIGSGLIAVLFLSSIFGASGMTTGVHTDPTLPPREVEAHIEFTIGTMTVEMVEQPGGYLFVYKQAGAVHRVAVVGESEGIRYSINGGQWRGVQGGLVESSSPDSSEITSLSSSREPEFRFRTTYWWDGVRHMRGYPAVYPHPDRGYYHIFAKNDWRYWGIQLLHFQLGGDNAGLIANLGPVFIGMAIGGVIGWLVGGPVGTAVGSFAGAIIGGLLAYYYNVLFVDESGAIWWWINRGLFSAVRSIPWWLWYCGRCMEAYIVSHIDYLRVGSHTAVNQMGIWGP